MVHVERNRQQQFPVSETTRWDFSDQIKSHSDGCKFKTITSDKQKHNGNVPENSIKKNSQYILLKWGAFKKLTYIVHVKESHGKNPQIKKINKLKLAQNKVLFNSIIYLLSPCALLQK